VTTAYALRYDVSIMIIIDSYFILIERENDDHALDSVQSFLLATV
jgi:hypothetical protein